MINLWLVTFVPLVCCLVLWVILSSWSEVVASCEQQGLWRCEQQGLWVPGISYLSGGS